MSEPESAFDNYALSYDADFTHSAVGVLQRKRVWSYLSKNCSSEIQKKVLEINCGTGEDALWFFKQGYSVTATDLSTEMVGVAKEKLRDKNVSVFQSDLRLIGEKLKTQQFDLIFSDFGGLNCLSPDELKKISTEFSKLLTENGRLIFVIMGRNCKWERWYFKRKGDQASAFRRRSKEGIEAIIFDQKFSTYYYSPNEIEEIFSEQFALRKVKPIGIALPPSYLDNYFRKRPLFLKTLNVLEKILGNLSSFSDKADHYIIDLTKWEKS